MRIQVGLSGKLHRVVESDSMAEQVTREEFLNQLHDALNHLYNADLLRTSSLAELFGVARRFDTSSVLRKILTDSIESIRPSSSEPDQSRAWRIFDSLYCCYVQQLNQQVVADQLCISARQLRREQHRALEVLADRLWQKYNLDAGLVLEDKKKSTDSDLVEELAWLRDTQPTDPARLEAELSSVLNLTRSLAFRMHVDIVNRVPSNLPDLAVHPVVLNQLLVSLVGNAIQQAANGRLLISSRLSRSMIELEMDVQPQAGVTISDEEVNSGLQVSAELAKMCGCLLLFPISSTNPTTRLILPTREQLPILVIDDNEDVLELMKRYAAGSRYRLITSRDSDQILQLVEKHAPLMIVLDIMMPKENGWMVLGRLKQIPQTRAIPVIICTILAQEKLALSLGATMFLKKPVSRSAFIQTLDQVLSQSEPEFLSAPE
jgi:CheY-like chemotaxis protein